MICAARDPSQWESTPRHPQLETWALNQRNNIWRPEIKGHVYISIAIVPTWYEVSDFQHYCETVRNRNAMLLRPTGVGLPSDLRWGWPHTCLLDSEAFGDIIAEEWVCYSCDADLKGEFLQTPRRLRGDVANADRRKSGGYLSGMV